MVIVLLIVVFSEIAGIPFVYVTALQCIFRWQIVRTLFVDKQQTKAYMRAIYVWQTGLVKEEQV